MRSSALIFALPALLFTEPAFARTIRYALAIGVNAPPSEDLPRLRYADDDAARFFAYFSRSADHVVLLAELDTDTQRRSPQTATLSRRATLANLRQAVSSFASSMANDRARGDRPEFFLTYSGHGFARPDGKIALALEQGELDRGILYDEIVAKLPAEVHHLLVDACHAEAVVGSRGRGYVDSTGLAPVSFVESTERSSGRGLGVRKSLAIASWVVSGASMVTSAVALGFALQAKFDFDRTDVQARARPAADRFYAWEVTAIATTSAGLALAVAGALLWPRHVPIFGVIPTTDGAMFSLSLSH